MILLYAATMFPSSIRSYESNKVHIINSFQKNIFTFVYFYVIYFYKTVYRHNVVGIATRFGLPGPGIESECGARLSAPARTFSWATQPAVQWLLVHF